MPDRIRRRYPFIPCDSYLYAALVLGFSLGIVFYDDKKRAELPRVNFDSIPHLQWDAPVPLRVVTGHYLKDGDELPITGDAMPLNWAPHRCRTDNRANPACAYLNATHATHPKAVVERWTQSLSKRNISVIVDAT